MKLNNWESKSEEFLSDVFDGDSKDIVEFLKNINPSTIAEIGFGNNRLLLNILNSVKNVTYFGFDKTKVFVDRARDNFSSHKAYFDILDITDTVKLSNVLNSISPNVLILRYIVEHLPNWKKVLDSLNTLRIPTIILSIYTPIMKNKSWTLYEIDKKIENAYTVNFISGHELNQTLNNYILQKVKSYGNVDHTLRIYKTI